MTEEHDVAFARALAHARFEVIPIAGAEEQAGYLPRGTTVTVTCSPARGLDATLRHAEQLAQEGLRAVPHIAARLVVDTAHLRDVVQRLADLQVRDVFVVGGDARWPVGRFSSALDLLRAMAELGHGFDEIGVAAYPEHHPLIDDTVLRQALADKQPFATYMVSQICFDAQVIARWIADTRQRGVALPVYIGVPGVVDRAHLLRISIKVGVGASLRFVAKHTGLTTTLLKPGSYRPTALVEELAQYFGDPRYDIRGLHLNTFNQVEATEEWRRQMLSPAADEAGVLSRPPVGGSRRRKESP